MAEDAEKTEEATPHRLEEARSKGDVPQSRDFTSFLVLLGLAISTYFFSRFILNQTIDVIRRFLDLKEFSVDTPKEFLSMFSVVIKDILYLVSPIFASAFIFAVGGCVSQFGFLVTGDKIMPKFDKLNPLNGFKRIFSRDTLMEFIRSCLKIFVILGMLYLLLKGDFEKISQLGAAPIGFIFQYFIGLIAKIVFAILIFMAVLGIGDLAYQRWSYAERMKMSMEEIKEEMKQREGDPKIKSRIRQMQRERARSRMMEEVPKADVVVTNPTHVAVALKYKRGLMRAPIVVAKGAGLIALRIKEVAAVAQIPILERRELARYLYRNVEINEVIPDSLYTAVAEVLAYVYRMKKKFRGWMKGAQPHAV